MYNLLIEVVFKNTGFILITQVAFYGEGGRIKGITVISSRLFYTLLHVFFLM